MHARGRCDRGRACSVTGWRRVRVESTWKSPRLPLDDSSWEPKWHMSAAVRPFTPLYASIQLVCSVDMLFPTDLPISVHKHGADTPDDRLDTAIKWTRSHCLHPHSFNLVVARRILHQRDAARLVQPVASASYYGAAMVRTPLAPLHARQHADWLSAAGRTQRVCVLRDAGRPSDSQARQWNSIARQQAVSGGTLRRRKERSCPHPAAGLGTVR